MVGLIRLLQGPKSFLLVEKICEPQWPPLITLVWGLKHHVWKGQFKKSLRVIFAQRICLSGIHMFKLHKCWLIWLLPLSNAFLSVKPRSTPSGRIEHLRAR